MASNTNSPKPSLSAASGDGSKNRSPSRAGPTPTTPASVTRTRSVRTTPSTAATARAAGRKAGSKDDDARAETNSMIEDLKEQLRKTESASDDYRKQLAVLQSRLDEALGEQTKLEEGSAQHLDTISNLKSELQETQRARNDVQLALEKEQAVSTEEKEAALARENEQNEIISRLKDSLAQRESRKSMVLDGSMARTASLRGRSSPNPEGSSSPMRRDSSQHTSQLLLQKDKVIEELRLELAEAHVKIMEVDRAGGGRMQELERQFLEVRMTNAKLMEDNESYQYLLQERTMSGDMAQKFTPSTPADSANISRAPSRDKTGGNLADELETVGEEEEPDDRLRKLEKELSAQKDQNKALTLYINRIIGRLLANDKFEQLFENGDVTGESPLSAAAQPKAQFDKELPGIPTPADDEAGKENVAPGGSLLSRAGSIFGAARAKTRPMSYQPSQTEVLPRGSIDHGGGDDGFTAKPLTSANEDQTLAPRVPLHRGGSTRINGPRGHRRTTSDVSASGSTPASYAGRGTGGGTLSPPLTISGTSSLNPTSPPGTSHGIQDGISEDLGGMPIRGPRTTTDSGYGESIDLPSSPPRTSEVSRSSGTGAIVSGGKQMRPLRLVQEKVEAEEERRRANRSSWMGWLSKGQKVDGPPTGVQPPPK